MQIQVVTCSGANEHTEIAGLFNLASRSVVEVEFGIQASGKKASFGTARYWWLKSLYYYQQANKKLLSLSLHLNCDWVERFCKGEVPDEVDEFLSLKNYDGTYFIGAVQLNFKVGRERKPKVTNLIEVMNRYPHQQFILSYNDNNFGVISQLYNANVEFDLLYDDSYGEGIVPQERHAPLFDDVTQGYAGGFSPENIYEELNKLSKIVPKKRNIFIDAEGRLKGDNGHFSVERAELFVDEVNRWIKNH